MVLAEVKGVMVHLAQFKCFKNKFPLFKHKITYITIMLPEHLNDVTEDISRS